MATSTQRARPAFSPLRSVRKSEMDYVERQLAASMRDIGE